MRPGFAIVTALALAIAAPTQGFAKSAPVVFKSRPAALCKPSACIRGAEGYSTPSPTPRLFGLQ